MALGRMLRGALPTELVKAYKKQHHKEKGTEVKVGLRDRRGYLFEEWKDALAEEKDKGKKEKKEKEKKEKKEKKERKEKKEKEKKEKKEKEKKEKEKKKQDKVSEKAFPQNEDQMNGDGVWIINIFIRLYIYSFNIISTMCFLRPFITFLSVHFSVLHFQTFIF